MSDEYGFEGAAGDWGICSAGSEEAVLIQAAIGADLLSEAGISRSWYEWWQH